MISEKKITWARQHWLKFAWQKTWRSQELAGIKVDTTLMFNDRSGFRAAAAISWNPWDQINNRPHKLSEKPTILMDSHLYDYNNSEDTDIKKQLKYLIEEVYSVNGTAGVLWHPHTLTSDYGWQEGFIQLLIEIHERVKKWKKTTISMK